MNKYRNNFKPYLINAFYTWAMDINFTPLIEVSNASKNKVPDSLKSKDTIIFNIHPSSVRNLIFGKDFIEFEARFSGEPCGLSIAHDTIKKIFSKEDGYGLEFKVFDEVNKVESNLYSDTDTLKPIRQKKHLVLIKND